MTRRRFGFSLLAVATLVVACNSDSKWIRAKTSRTVTLDPAADRTDVAAVVAEELTLVLPRVNEPGYEWRLVSHDSRVLKQTTLVAKAPGAESATVSFVTQRANARTWLRFVVVREGAREDAPVGYHEVLVTVAAAQTTK